MQYSLGNELRGDALAERLLWFLHQWIEADQQCRIESASEAPTEEEFYMDQPVIGSAFMYHLRSCHHVARIYSRNHKLLRNAREAVELGLHPCSWCQPYYPGPQMPPKVGF